MRKAWKRVAREQRGYSLIELLITMAILGLVLGSLTTVLVSGSKAELDMNRRFQAQQNARMAFSTLRSDIHLATCASTLTAPTVPAGQLYLYTNATGTRATCTGSPSIVWCVYNFANAPIVRDRLYRIANNSCPGTLVAALNAGAVLKADYLKTTLLFTDPGFPSPAAASQQHQSIAATLPVSTGVKAGLDNYTLTDTIVLRNSPRT